MNSNFKKIRPSDVETREFYGLMTSAVNPRPIAFASTISKENVVNLSPYSFFNVFSAKPPIVVFAPVTRMRNGTDKDTLNNVREVPEVVIHTVNYEIVEQMSLSSTEYGPEINEFEKAGFTEVDSEKVKPPRALEAPVAMECKVNDIIDLGTEGGAGHLIIAEVVLIHVRENILGVNGQIDPHKLDSVGRLGGSYYCRASGESIFSVLRPSRNLGIGFDALPDFIRKSEVLTGADLAKMANSEKVPEYDTTKIPTQNADLHKKIKDYLNENEIEKAWKCALGV